MSNTHKIQTLTFDLEVPSKEIVPEIQNQVIDAFNSEFTIMLNDVFNVYGNDNDIIINSLTIQLDPIEFSQLNTDFIQQCREQLLSYFENNKFKDNSMEEDTLDTDENLTKWYLNNSGLIIVHPFLNQLFNSLEYLNEEKQFKNEKLMWRAVYLLHYLATGKNSDINEADLAIPKILAGMRIADPITSNLNLSKIEKDNADELLIAVITHWEKLGNTSTEGLQNTFFIREGILEEKNETFQLTVESKGVDILVDYIPWNINMVKLPWVKQIIYTSWR